MKMQRSHGFEPLTLSFADGSTHVSLKIPIMHPGFSWWLQGAEKSVKAFEKVQDVPLDPIELSIFGHRFMSIAE